MRGWLLVIVVVILLAALGSVLPLTYMCAFYGSGTDLTCVAVEIVNKWQTYVSGILALAAAAATIAYIRFQMNQLDMHREEDLRREGQSITATLSADVLDTADRIKTASHASDVDPPMSGTARGMIFEAAKISPDLAIALQKHCSEIGGFESELKAIPAGANPRLAQLLTKRQALSYRAHVLSHCFAVAANQIMTGGVAKGPFINQRDLDSIEAAYAVGNAERSYLAHTFATSGIA